MYRAAPGGTPVRMVRWQPRSKGCPCITIPEKPFSDLAVAYSQSRKNGKERGGKISHKAVKSKEGKEEVHVTRVHNKKGGGGKADIVLPQTYPVAWHSHPSGCLDAPRACYLVPPSADDVEQFVRDAEAEGEFHIVTTEPGMYIVRVGALRDLDDGGEALAARVRREENAVSKKIQACAEGCSKRGELHKDYVLHWDELMNKGGCPTYFIPW